MRSKRPFAPSIQLDPLTYILNGPRSSYLLYMVRHKAFYHVSYGRLVKDRPFPPRPLFCIEEELYSLVVGMAEQEAISFCFGLVYLMLQDGLEVPSSALTAYGGESKGRKALFYPVRGAH